MPHQTRFDKVKLKGVLIDAYKDMGKQVYKVVKQVYTDLKVGPQWDLDQYCSTTQRLLNKPLEFITKLFFNILDFNEDGRLCEQDLFYAQSSLTSQDLSLILGDDLNLVLSALKSKGPTYKVHYKLKRLDEAVRRTRQTGMLQPREDFVERTKLFFQSV